MSRLLLGSNGDEVPRQVLLILAVRKKQNPSKQRNRQVESTACALADLMARGAHHLPLHPIVQRTGWGNQAGWRKNPRVAQCVMVLQLLRDVLHQSSDVGVS